jgi:DNA-binding NarL/FixJ family response regulator
MRGAACPGILKGVRSGIVIVDDNRSFAEVARRLLERQGESVVGLASTSAAAVELVAELRPDVVLVDLALGDESGLDVVQLLAAQCDCDAPTLILISACSPTDVAGMMATTPAAGFLPKVDLSVDAIHRIVANDRISGEAPISPAAARSPDASMAGGGSCRPWVRTRNDEQRTAPGARTEPGRASHGWAGHG